MDNKSSNLEGKVAIVTGASKGIGEAIALGLGKAGAKVIVSSRKQDAIEKVVDNFRKEGIEATAIAAQMGNMNDIENLVKQTVEVYGSIDIIINNAATNPIFGPVKDAELAAFDKISDVNVKGPFYLAKLAYPHMKNSGGGSVINISSVEGLNPGFGLGLYSVSKASLIMLTKVLAKEWGRDNIRANVICPGLIKTKFSEALWTNDKIMNQVMSKQPLQRIGEPEDIVNTTLVLASDAGSYITGAVFTIDGGLTI